MKARSGEDQRLWLNIAAHGLEMEATIRFGDEEARVWRRGGGGVGGNLGEEEVE
jgi:hypothetical protein